MSDLHFVIQQHTTTSGVHWDLMLEHEGTLWTWRLDTPPEQIDNKPVAAERIADHPIRFLKYEGPVQNATGRVNLADKGTLLWQTLSAAHIRVQLDGHILKGAYNLTLKNEPYWIFKSES